jgi:hypothetical protein
MQVDISWYRVLYEGKTSIIVTAWKSICLNDGVIERAL